MKFQLLLLLPFLLLGSCNTKDETNPGAKVAQDAITHYFTAKAGVSRTHQPYFITGDFNGDGMMDLAILFQPAQPLAVTKQVEVSTPWAFPGSSQSETYQTSLAIINGSNGGWLAPDTRVFALIDKSGSLQTPSFQLMLRKKTDKDYSRIQATLPAKHSGDLIVLPTEAGIDTYIFWDQSKYRLYIPTEIP